VGEVVGEGAEVDEMSVWGGMEGRGRTKDGGTMHSIPPHIPIPPPPFPIQTVIKSPLTFIPLHIP